MAQERKRRRVNVPAKHDKKGPSLAVIAAMFIIVPFWPIGVLLCLLRVRNSWRHKKYVDYSNYAAIIGTEPEISLEEIAATANKTMAQVQNDLQTMIGKGYMGKNAYIDHARNVLVLEKIRKTAPQEPEVQATEIKHEEPEEKKNVRPQTPPQKSQEETFEEILRKMRDLNDDIDDEEISRDIDRIGELTSNIFNIVRAHPERKEEVRKFMDYYLPTTFSLLESYAMMEEQSYQSENIVESRKKIAGIMNRLVEAFEKQHDRMFRKDALDVDTEITVLEQMLASDGLVSTPGTDIHAEFERRRREGVKQ